MSNGIVLKQRSPAIDMLKFMAVLCIFNAHSTMIYPACPWLATGGYIGDALFFFCSGYTLLMDNGAHLCQFDNWYKRRLARIWPSCLAWGFAASLFLGRSVSVLAAFKGIGWFVSCILIYYVIVWCIGRYALKRVREVYVASILLSIAALCAYLRLGCADTFYWKALFFFPIMLTGCLMGIDRTKGTGRCGVNLLLAIVSLLLFTGCIAFATRHANPVVRYVQILGMPLLIGVVVFTYRAVASAALDQYVEEKWWSAILLGGGLCLDFYFVKAVFITDALNFMFPLNLPVLLVYLLFVAYLNRCLGRFIQQTISSAKTPYDWRAIISI